MEATSPSEAADEPHPPHDSQIWASQDSSGAPEVSGREAAESPARAAMREMWRFFEGYADLVDILLGDCDRMTQPEAVVRLFLSPHPMRGFTPMNNRCKETASLAIHIVHYLHSSFSMGTILQKSIFGIS